MKEENDDFSLQSPIVSWQKDEHKWVTLHYRGKKDEKENSFLFLDIIEK